MAPAGLLAIIALGIVLAYVIPQRIKERSDYGMVRTEDRYSAEMRVVKSTARRFEMPTQRASTNSGEVPLLVTGAARASVAALGDEPMSRPVGPLDRAATAARRQSLSMRHDRQTILRERAAQARRRAWVAALAAFVTVVAWIVVAVTPAPGLVGALATAGFGGVVVAGARAAGAQRKADEKVLRVAREVEAAATATQALRRVARERAAGVEAAPSDLETQAIKVVTSEDLAPLAAPRPVPAPDLPAFAEPVASEPIASVEDEAAWTPNAVPAPAYTLKPSVKQQLARPLTDDDFAAAERAARAAQDRAATRSNTDAHPTTGALDAILARRRRSA